ncbi:MAG: hypothetical protein JRF56_07070 [Deltaproteobacteria bacterium]|jgi:hypothetical protein|nr:hypothetical protein [Deltaproteobacteria bacterium]
MSGDFHQHTNYTDGPYPLQVTKYIHKSYPDMHADAVAACALMQEQKDAALIEDGWIVFAHIERDGPWTAENGGGYNVKDLNQDKNYSLGEIVEGIRAGISFFVMGDLIDALDLSVSSRWRSAPMGGELLVRHGADVEIEIKFKGPATNHCVEGDALGYCPAPIADHIDLIAGSITGMKEPGSAEYTKASNESTRVIATFTADDWEAEGEYNVICYKINRLRNDM